MVLEAIVICVDNSDWMRNGDFEPNRLSLQNESINSYSSIKTKDNTQNTIGIIKMAGVGNKVLILHTRELGVIMNELNKLKPDGTCNILTSLKTAGLVLKNRINKNQKQRVIMFVGSPVKENINDLIEVGKNMKKNNISIDVINFDSANNEKFKQFYDQLHFKKNSKLINVEPSSINTPSKIISFLSDTITNTKTSNTNENIDDPDLQLAIKMSIEEEEKRKKTKKIKKDSNMHDNEIKMAYNLAINIKRKDEEKIDEDQKMRSIDERDNEIEEVLKDEKFLEELIDSLPNVKKDEIDIKEIMEDVGKKEKEEDNKDSEKKEEDKNNGKGGK